MATIKFTTAFPFYDETLPAIKSDVPDNYPATVGGAVGNEVEVRMQETIPAGKYKIELSAFTYIDSTSNSIRLRASSDGGTTWFEFYDEASDTGVDTRTAFSYAYSIDYAVDTTLDYIIQMRKDAATNTMNVHFVNILFQKVGEV